MDRLGLGCCHSTTYIWIADTHSNPGPNADTYLNSIVVRGGGWINPDSGSFGLPANGGRHMDF